MPPSIKLALVAVFTAGLAHSPAHSASEKVVYSFQSSREGVFFSALTALDGALYGLAAQGGIAGCGYVMRGCGVIFRVTPAGKETTLHMFNGDDGEIPVALAGKNHRLDGVTDIGGGNTDTCIAGCGVAYTITEAGTLTITHLFGAAGDGTFPSGVTEFGRTVYGTTFQGGLGDGTIFAIGPTGYRTAFSFRGRGSHGSHP